MDLINELLYAAISQAKRSVPDCTNQDLVDVLTVLEDLSTVADKWGTTSRRLGKCVAGLLQKNIEDRTGGPLEPERTAAAFQGTDSLPFCTPPARTHSAHPAGPSPLTSSGAPNAHRVPRYALNPHPVRFY